MKASERLAKLRDLQVPEAQAMDLVKSAISAGEVENDLEQASTIDVKKLEGILEELRKSQAAVAEPVQPIIPATAGLELTGLFNATVAEVKAETSKLSKALVSIGEMISELTVHLTSLDQRNAEIAKSLSGAPRAAATPVPQSVIGAVTSAPSPHDQLAAGHSPDDIVRLRKSLVGKLTTELRAGGTNDARRLELATALANAASANDPAAFAKSVGISL
jgi:hypothetical protein